MNAETSAYTNLQEKNKKHEQKYLLKVFRLVLTTKR